MAEAERAWPSKPTVSAVVFSLNEGHLLPDCLERLADFDDLLVCDMASEDDTQAVARAYGARRIEVPRVPIVEQVRQVALDAVTTDWVLFVDADEILPVGFRGLLDRAINEEPAAVAMRLRYDNYAFGYRLSHTLKGSAKYSLLRRGKVRYSDRHPVHVPPDFQGAVVDAPGFMPAIEHLNFRDTDQSLEKVLRYSEHMRSADDRLIRSPWALIRELIRVTIFGGAWRDGRAGVFVVTANVFGRYYAQAKSWESEGFPDLAWSPRERRTLSVVERAQRLLVLVRDAVLRR